MVGLELRDGLLEQSQLVMIPPTLTQPQARMTFRAPWPMSLTTTR